MKKLREIILVPRLVWLLLALMVLNFAAGCSTWHKLNNTEKGAVIGAGSGAAVIGAATGSPGGAVLGGAAAGVAGGLIGNEMDKDEDKNR